MAFLGRMTHLILKWLTIPIESRRTSRMQALLPAPWATLSRGVVALIISRLIGECRSDHRTKEVTKGSRLLHYFSIWLLKNVRGRRSKRMTQKWLPTQHLNIFCETLTHARPQGTIKCNKVFNQSSVPGKNTSKCCFVWQYSPVFHPLTPSDPALLESLPVSCTWTPGTLCVCMYEWPSGTLCLCMNGNHCKTVNSSEAPSGAELRKSWP